jgi:hypothetical protein
MGLLLCVPSPRRCGLGGGSGGWGEFKRPHAQLLTVLFDGIIGHHSAATFSGWLCFDGSLGIFEIPSFAISMNLSRKPGTISSAF